MFSSLGHDLSHWIHHQTTAPECQMALATAPIDRGDEDAVGDRVGPVHRDPGIVLPGLFMGGFVVTPRNRRRKKKYLGPTQGDESGRFGKPLVPADEHAQMSLGRLVCWPGPASVVTFTWRIARCEIVFLKEVWVIRDVHLAISAHDRTTRINHDGRVVVDAGVASFEQRGDQMNSRFLGQTAQLLADGSRNRLGQ